MALTTEQAATLLAKCDHPVATCPVCRTSFRARELSPLFFTTTSGKRYGCHECRRDLTAQVEYHIETCRHFASPKA
jgi:transposase-like protein